jgi:hypothetical protein
MGKAMTDGEVLAELRTDSVLNRARRALSSHCGRIEHAQAQRSPPSPVDVRRMEFDAVREIASLLGVEL